MTNELRTLAVSTDTRLAELLTAAGNARRDIDRATTSLLYAAGGARTADRHGNYTWDIDTDEARARVAAGNCRLYGLADARESITTINAATALLSTLQAEIATLHAVYLQHRWTRAFLVLNHDGHVHSMTECSTCYPTTTFHWVTEYSGAEEAEIVAAAGRHACTVCYPSAPIDGHFEQDSRILPPDHAAKVAARDERNAAKVARDAKALKAAATLDGSSLKIRTNWGRETFKTEVTAVTWYTDHKAIWDVDGKHEELREAYRIIEEALAEKHGITADEMRVLLAAKVAAKRKKHNR